MFTIYTHVKKPVIWITNNLNAFFINLDNKYGTNFSAKQTISTEIVSNNNKKILNSINEFVSETFVLGFIDFVTQYMCNFYTLLILVVIGWASVAHSKILQSNKLLLNILTFAEHEFNNFLSFRWVLVNLLFFFFINFQWFFISYMSSPMFVICMAVAGVLFTLISVIAIYLINTYGFFFIIYLKGSTSKNSINMELVTDLINLVSYFSRISLQLVRLAIILGTFFLYNEVYVDYIYPFFSTNFISSTSYLDIIVLTLKTHVGIILHFLYELIHFFILFLTQSTAFSMVILILLQFLYTSLTDVNLEKFFSTKRLF